MSDTITVALSAKKFQTVIDALHLASEHEGPYGGVDSEEGDSPDSVIWAQWDRPNIYSDLFIELTQIRAASKGQSR
jgi:hypothetical protein